jgi:CheY-like chemotaxis protein
MAGEITLSSEPGRGSSFRVRLRLLQQRDSEDATASFNHYCGHRALLLETSVPARIAMEQQLRSLGMRCDRVESGPAVLEKIREAEIAGQHYEVVFIDSRLGSELINLCHAVLSASHNSKLVVVGQTARAAGIEQVQGRFALLNRPVQPSKLLAILAATPGENAQQEQGFGARIARQERADVCGHDHRVLVAEDNTVNQKVVRHLLEKLDCSVDLAANGSEAIEMCRKTTYDLILMDCHMPALDGYEATAIIKKFSRVPIVALTANAMQGDRETCLQAGMDDYLSKPIQRADLKRVLERWCSRDRKLVDEISAPTR